MHSKLAQKKRHRRRPKVCTARRVDRTDGLYQPPFLFVVSLWLFQSIFSASQVDFSGKVEGITIQFRVQDAVFGAFISWMLRRGMTTRNVSLVIPWVLVSLYETYFIQYKDLTRMLAILQMIRKPAFLAWPTMLVTAVALGSRLFFILYVLKASFCIWYGKALEFELLGKVHQE